MTVHGFPQREVPNSVRLRFCLTELQADPPAEKSCNTQTCYSQYPQAPVIPPH